MIQDPAKDIADRNEADQAGRLKKYLRRNRHYAEQVRQALSALLARQVSEDELVSDLLAKVRQRKAKKDVSPRRTAHPLKKSKVGQGR